VINQMLKDLEKRQGSGSSYEAMARHESGGHRPRWGRLGMVLLVLGAALAGALGQRWWQAAPTPTESPAAAHGSVTGPRSGGAGWDRPEIATARVAEAAPQPDAAPGGEQPALAAVVAAAPVDEPPEAQDEVAADDQRAVAPTPVGAMPLVDESATAADVPAVLRQNVADPGAAPIAFEEWLPETVPEVKPPPRLAVAPSAVSPAELARRKAKEGDDAYARRQYPQALARYREALALDPEPLAWRRRATELALASGDRPLARQLLAEGIRQHAQDIGLRMALASLLREDKDYASALAALEGAQPSASERFEFHRLRGGLAQQVQNWSVARQSYEALVLLAPTDGRHWLGLAIATDGLGQSALAISNYQRALSLPGLSPQAQAYVRQRLAQLKG